MMNRVLFSWVSSKIDVAEMIMKRDDDRNGKKKKKKNKERWFNSMTVDTVDDFLGNIERKTRLKKCSFITFIIRFAYGLLYIYT